MWKKIAIVGAVTAATAGGGSAALATSGWPASTTSGSGSSATALSAATMASATSAVAGQGGARAGHLLRRMAHGQWVARDRQTGSWVTHDAIRGSVTAVSATSITVKAPDDVSETFTVTSGTKVRQRQDKKGTDSTINAVRTGDNVVVLGTGSTTMTATWVVDVKK